MMLTQLHFTCFCSDKSLRLNEPPPIPPILPVIEFSFLGKFPSLYLPLIPLTQDMMITIITTQEMRITIITTRNMIHTIIALQEMINTVSMTHLNLSFLPL